MDRYDFYELLLDEIEKQGLTVRKCIDLENMTWKIQNVKKVMDFMKVNRYFNRIPKI